jgi:hypothetical protein
VKAEVRAEKIAARKINFAPGSRVNYGKRAAVFAKKFPALAATI